MVAVGLNHPWQLLWGLIKSPLSPTFFQFTNFDSLAHLGLEGPASTCRVITH